MRYQARREVNGNPDFAIWSFAVIDDFTIYTLNYKKFSFIILSSIMT